MSNPLHHVLKSGRVLLLESPLTDEELEAVRTPDGNAVMEALADIIASRSTKHLDETHAAYTEMLKKHGIHNPSRN